MRGVVTLIAAGPVLPGYPARARRLAVAALGRAGVRIIEGDACAEVAALAVRLASGATLECDAALLATGAVAPAWLAATGLACDAAGYVAVGPTLQAIGRPEVFAAGDCAAMAWAPRPKAGVFAVRQGPVLAANLRALARGDPLCRYRPQRRWLSLIATGDGGAIAVYGGLAVAGGRAGWWKDRIDRRFMAQFSSLVPRPD